MAFANYECGFFVDLKTNELYILRLIKKFYQSQYGFDLLVKNAKTL